MASFTTDESKLRNLKDKVVVITGGASGIGKAAVIAFHNLGAKVVFGDIQLEAGAELADTLSRESVKFVKTDVSKYDDHLALFDLALKSFGRVDIAVSNAGISQEGYWMDPRLDLEGVKKHPNTATVEVNLLGTLYFTRIATVYLRQHQTSDDDKAIIVLSSTAGFYESGGIPVYSATKHGVLGMMRSCRLTLPSAGIRINAICPWATDTAMGAGLVAPWKKYNIPLNSAEGVANIITGVAAQSDMNGKAVIVSGNKGLEMEERIKALQPQLYGEEPAKEFEMGQIVFEKLVTAMRNAS